MESKNEDTLIKLYEERTVLWDTRLKNYHNRDKRRYALEEISRILNISIVEVKKKIHSLRTSFMNEKKRLAKKQSSGISFKKSKKFQSLQFLDPVCFPTTNTSAKICLHNQTNDGIEDRDTKEPLQFFQKQNNVAPVEIVSQKQDTPTSTFSIHLESLIKEFPKEDRDEFEADVLAQAYAKKREIVKRNKKSF